MTLATYVMKRLALAVLTVLLLLTFTFVVARSTGDPTASLLPPIATDDDRAAMRQLLHLDRPLWQQYGEFLADVARGNLGQSYKWHEPVTQLIVDRLPVTITLALLAGGITLCFGLPLGIISARNRGRVADRVILLIALLGQSVPIFVTALAGILLFSVKLRWLPAAGVDVPQGYIIPAITLGWFGLAAMIRVTRVSMLNALGSEYIITARAKGLRSRTIVYEHALRNALIPILTIFSLILATLLTGTVVTETMFALPGLGRTAVEAITGRDFPVVQGVVLVTTCAFVSINLIVDVVYGFIDPRTRNVAA
jgi:peptide/nickel transport system permease protein